VLAGYAVGRQDLRDPVNGALFCRAHLPGRPGRLRPAARRYPAAGADSDRPMVIALLFPIAGLLGPPSIVR